MSKKAKSIIVILVGLLLVGVGIVATVLLVQRFQSARAAQEQSTEVVKTNIVVVTRDLKLGDLLQAADVEIVEIPVEVSPRDAITKTEDAVGKYIKTDLIQGEMVLEHNLADPTNVNHDLAYILSDDHVLMAWAPNDLMTGENIIQRGDIVDIFATFSKLVEEVPDGATTTTTEGTGEPVTRTFTLDSFQKIPITALVMDVIQPETTNNAGEVVPAQTAISSYLLSLDPQDALVLKHLSDTGATFDLVLRAPTSTGTFDLTPVTEDYIVEFYGLEILP